MSVSLKVFIRSNSIIFIEGIFRWCWTKVQMTISYLWTYGEDYCQSFLSWILNPCAVIQVFFLISSSVVLLLRIVTCLYWICSSNGCMRAVGCAIFVSLQSLGHFRNVVSRSLLYRFLAQMAQWVTFLYSHVRFTRHCNGFHDLQYHS